MSLDPGKQKTENRTITVENEKFRDIEKIIELIIRLNILKSIQCTYCTVICVYILLKLV